MKITEKHEAAFEPLADNEYRGKPGRRSQPDIADDLGVHPRTIKKWKADPDFQAAYQDYKRRRRQAFEDIRFAAPRERVLELQRMYDDTPSSVVVRHISSDQPVIDPRTGQVLVDAQGKEVRHMEVRKLNVRVKMALLEAIAREVGDRDPQNHPSADPAVRSVLILPAADMGCLDGLEPDTPK